ncbi:MAG: alpha/beta hydrolase [Chloroflexales bacterium]|nr:alpha/beta hydrolase [Chloroflexales bacterium]
MSFFVQANGIQLHFADKPGGSPPLVLVHGLTANCRCFDVVASQLAPRLRVIAPDMRGRGASDRPDAGYTMADHAADVLGLLDALGLGQVVMGGHSFGGLLSLYMAANHAERIAGVVVINAAISAASERTRELIRPALARLERAYPSFEAYLDLLRQAPYYHGWAWDPAVEAYYQADVEMAADGSVYPRSRPAHIAAAADGVIAEPWRAHLARVERPVLMLHATGPYGPPGAPPIVSPEQADETRALLSGCAYVHVPGNHMTMLYGEGARAIADAILAFVNG